MSSSRFIHRLAAVLGVLDFIVFAKIVMNDIIAYKPTSTWEYCSSFWG
jgi:hypothetical protein